MDHLTWVLLIQGFLILNIAMTHADEFVVISGEEVAARRAGAGESYKVDCEVTDLVDSPTPGLKWFDPSGNIIDPSADGSAKMFVESPTSNDQRVLTLKIRSLDPGDSGVYECADNDGHKDTVQLTVFEPIQVTPEKVPPVQKFTVNKTANVKCDMSANGITIKWRNQSSHVITGDHPRIAQLQDGTLQIRNIQLIDNGTYICEVESGHEFKQIEVDVVVQVPPTIYQPPSRQEAIEESSMRMDCRAEGIPKPKYEWFKVGHTNKLEDGDRFRIDINEGFINITHVIVDDAGTYQCRAFNGAGQEFKEAELDVLIRPKIQQLNNVTDNAGGSVVLSCVVHGDPLPTITWKNINTDFTYSVGSQDPDGNSPGSGSSVKWNVGERDSIEEKTRTSELTINNLERRDAGQYLCDAYSGRAGSTSGIAFLMVQYKPEFAPDQEDQAYSWPGGKVNLECNVLAVPSPTIQWFDNEGLIVEGKTYYKQSTTYIGDESYRGILEVKVDFGNEGTAFQTYVCEASNDRGTSQRNITLSKASVPIINLISEVLVTPTSASFNVEVARIINGPRPRNVSVKYGNEEQVVHIRDDNRPVFIELNGLIPSTDYAFEFYSGSEAGKSVVYPQSVRTPDPREPYEVTLAWDLNKEGQYATSYLLRWTTPKSGGRAITGYTIEYKMIEILDELTVDNQFQYKSDKQRAKTLDVKGQATSIELKDLVQDSYYQVTIKAYNMLGTGEAGKSFIFHTKPVPDEELLAKQNTTEAPLEPGASESAMTKKTIPLSIGVIILIVIVVFIVLFVIVDVTCYFRNKCGVIMCLKERVGHAGSVDTRSKEPIMESGESEKDTLPIRGVQNKDSHLVEDEKKVPLLDSDGGAKDEVDEENEVAPKESQEIEPEDKQPVEDNKPVAEGEEAKDEAPPAAPEEAAATPEVAAAPHGEEKVGESTGGDATA